MNTAFHLALGAALAQDGIPLHYGDLPGEYQAALHGVVLMDRSHEGRVALDGKNRLDLVQRISTNDVAALREGESLPTIFTTPIGRVIDRVLAVHAGERLLLLAEPGRGPAVASYLARSIFFNDDARASDITSGTRQFVLAGPQADAVVRALSEDLATATGSPSRELNIAGHTARFTRIRPVSGAGWSVVLSEDAAEAVWRALLAAGSGAGLRPAGSLTYHVLRVRAGKPGVGRELSSEYIPLELGLWDEVSFTKGCYTGQEIIARMESRRRLAKTIVALTLDGPAEAPCPLCDEGKAVGTLTSSAQAPDGQRYGIGIVRMSSAQPGRVLSAGEAHARIERLAGVQPALQAETD